MVALPPLLIVSLWHTSAGRLCFARLSCLLILTSLLAMAQQRRIDCGYSGFGIPFSGVSPFPLMTKFYNRTPVLCARMCAARTGICDEKKARAIRIRTILVVVVTGGYCYEQKNNFDGGGDRMLLL